MLIDFDGNKCPEFCPNFEFTHCTYYVPADNDKECGFCKLPDYTYRCLADVTRGIPLSHSSVQDFLSCHNLYYKKDIRGIRVRTAFLSSPLKIGKLWDSVLGKYLGALDIDIPSIINEYEIPDFDVARVRAIYRAYKTLDIQVEPGYELQAKIDMELPFECPENSEWPNRQLPNLCITGYYDKKWPTHFDEDKVTGKPENYLDPYFIQSQVGTYFMADESLEYCTMKPIRRPDLKSTGKNKEEDADSYCERCYQDIISRPSYYFIGWNRETRKYGKVYHRGEFNLDEIKSRFGHIFREIYLSTVFNGWYKNDRVCSNVLPGVVCDMKPICSNNDNMNEDMFEIRKKEITF